MKKSDTPIIDRLILRRDFYLLMSLLLADQKVAEIKGVSNWTQDLHKTEVRRLLLWVATASRSLLDLSGQKTLGQQSCGEYWDDFTNVKEEQPLDFRRACNSTIHAEEMVLYRVSRESPGKIVRETDVYVDRLTIDGTHRNKMTRAQVDIIQFVKIGTAVINFFEEENNANH